MMEERKKRNLPARKTAAGELPAYLRKEKRRAAFAQEMYAEMEQQEYCPPVRRPSTRTLV